MPQKHLFILDPWDQLNLVLDSSLRLARALSDFGHNVWATSISELFWNQQGAGCWARPMRLEQDLAKTTHGPAEKMRLSDFSAIHVRKDPPIDPAYWTMTWILDGAGNNTRIYNEPNAIRRLNEKLSIFQFPDATRPALLSNNPDQLFEFLVQEAGGDGILKPLDLFGGRGVLRVDLHTTGESVVRELLHTETREGHFRLMQPFDKSIFAGEIRAFYIGGEPLAFCLKKPGAGQYLANTRAGASLQRWEPDRTTLARLKSVAAQLHSEGLSVVGFDVIGGYISEVNVTSPRLLQAPDDATNYYTRWAEWCINDVAQSA